MTRSLLTAIFLRLDAGAHQFVIDGPPVGSRVDGDLFSVGCAAAVRAERVENAPQILVDLESLQQRSFTKNMRENSSRNKSQ